MSESYIEHVFQGVNISQKCTDGYINLNQMAQAAGKRLQDWLDNKSTQDLFRQFQIRQNLNHADQRDLKPPLIIQRGRYGGTWAHPLIAIQFAQWCSPDFALCVSEWVIGWMTTGQNPLDRDRVSLRGTLKDESRLRMTDQVKRYLDQMRLYDDKKFRGEFYAQVHDAINTAITTETAKQMRKRLSDLIGRTVKHDDLIRDYFPIDYLQHYIAVCEASANLMLKDGLQPLIAVERAIEIILPATYKPQPIDFVEHIKFVHQRLQAPQYLINLP